MWVKRGAPSHCPPGMNTTVSDSPTTTAAPTTTGNGTVVTPGALVPFSAGGIVGLGVAWLVRRNEKISSPERREEADRRHCFLKGEDKHALRRCSCLS